MANLHPDIVAYIRRYVFEMKRGCPKGVLIHVRGFRYPDIDELVREGIIVGKTGWNGGYFLAGEVPTIRKAPNSLKGRMVELLRVINDPKAKALVVEYEKEITRRNNSR